MAEEIKQTGQVITVCSGKGGVGKTLLAVNLAVSLSKKNADVALIDGEFQFGDVGLAMDLQPSFTMKDIVEE
ncbi:P-loop NTPase [Aquisalibacillus elongatus]|uniref:P-loop NTPase n=1 Tax=Aquisalibacillus elongatus TaxID=485577 RepID=UPI000F51BC48|nr:P-loop NTPase [Aquisalibacillus elongatus]